jgi:hypothetical protein
MDDLRESYRLLEVEPGATPEELKRAYRDLVKVWHPDRFADDLRLQSRAQEKLKQINLAYAKISEPRVIPPARPAAPPEPAPRRAEPPAWKANFQRPASDEPVPPEAEAFPPRPKKNWEPTFVRVAILLFIGFQITVLAVILSVINTALSAKP